MILGALLIKLVNQDADVIQILHDSEFWWIGLFTRHQGNMGKSISFYPKSIEIQLHRVIEWFKSNSMVFYDHGIYFNVFEEYVLCAFQKYQH